MTGAFWILVFLIVIGVILYICDRIFYRGKTENIDTAIPSAETPEDETVPTGECCGLHIVCEKESLSPFTTEAEYYDDEELDDYKGREADSYTGEEAETFRDILLTMRAEDIAGWVRSLQVRGVNLPTEVREEVLLIIGEARQKSYGNT